MKRTRDQLRVELLAVAEEVIDELLEWHERSDAEAVVFPLDRQLIRSHLLPGRWDAPCKRAEPKAAYSPPTGV